MNVPAYLTEPPQADEPFGTLRYEDKLRSWVIKADPSVCEMAKRLFRGSTSLGPGLARFPATRRAAADLNWFMLRFPLQVLNPERWQQARMEAVQYALMLQETAKRPSRALPPTSFVGELAPFQEEGLAWLLNHTRTLLADQQGLGKTVQALAYIAARGENALPALVVAQPQILRQWGRMIKRFLHLPRQTGQLTLWTQGETTFHIIQGLRPYTLPDAAIYLIHYGLLRVWAEVLAQMQMRLLVFDEIQELRNPGSQKYKGAMDLALVVEDVKGMSGTPIHNLGGEIRPVLDILDYHCLGDEDSFRREWCVDGKSDLVQNPALLGDYLRREGLMLRRVKTQVASQFPPKHRRIVEIGMDDALYASLIEPAAELAQRLAGGVRYFERGRLQNEAIEIARRVTGIAKAGHVAAFVRALLESGQPVMLTAWHHDVWDIYLEHLGDFRPAMVTGQQTPTAKDRHVQRFIKGDTNLICVSLRTGAGLDGLQERCATLVNGELDWSPAVHSQLEDRLHRWGQQNEVIVYYLVAPEGTDQAMIEALGVKTEQFAGLTGDKVDTEEDQVLAQAAASEHMQRVIEKLQARAQPKGDPAQP